MKLFKKLAMLCVALTSTVGLGFAAACDFSVTTTPPASTASSSTESESASESSSENSESSSTDSDETPDSSDSSSSSEGNQVTPSFVYRVKVQNAGGFGLQGVRVTLYDGGEVVAEKVTTSTGYAAFGKSDILALGEYSIELSDIPAGYALAEPDATYQTLAVQGFEAYILLEPTGVLATTAPIGHGYKLGDVMYDFSVKTSDGDTFTLSQVLQEKELVLLNFWATWCGPCKREFPAMEQAYLAYQDKVAVLAVSTTDTMDAVKAFKAGTHPEAQQPLSFAMTSSSECGEDLTRYFSTNSIPTSIMIDRYGAITYYHAGSMTAMKDFTSRFDRFLGDNYQPTVIVGTGEDGSTGGGDDDSSLLLPDVSAPDVADIQTALGDGAADFTFEWDLDDEYSWPWLVGSNDNASGNGMDYITLPETLKVAHGGYATLIATFHAGPGDAVLFDYKITSEAACDILYVLVDGVPVQQLSGINKTGTCGAYVFREYETEGEHEIIFLYLKDDAGSVEGETVELRNLRIEQTAENVHNLVFRHAANNLNEAENATTLYTDYATVVYNEEDGYYHVGETDGPLLFANLMLSSRWSEMSVWLLAYYDYIISEGYNFHSDIEDFAWEANQPIPGVDLTYGYTPVTKELKELLQYVTASRSVAENGYKYFMGETHENEWLETCVYWEAYGNAEQLADPMKNITFHAAEEVFAGTADAPVKNVAEVKFAMTPRGFKYKFIPEQSGVYHIYSLGEQDTLCFFVAGDRTTFLGTYEDVIGATRVDANGNTVADMNFSFHHYLEAGETYYLLLTTYLDVSCTYDFYIDYVGDTYSYLENLSVGPYSYNEVSGELYLPDAKEYGYSDPTVDYDGDGIADGDGYYHVLNEDGSLGETIYVDMLHATVFFPYHSLQQIATEALSYEVENRAFYVNGVDYTTTIAKYARSASINSNSALRGYAALDQTLFEALVAITTSVKYEGISDSWQMLCYYYRTLGAN